MHPLELQDDLRKLNLMMGSEVRPSDHVPLTPASGSVLWRSMDRAPKSGYPIQHVQLLMTDGRVVMDAHWAFGGGEDQPFFGPAWFVPVRRADGSVIRFDEVAGTPKGWAEMPAPNNQALPEGGANQP